jgi:hypothetical protein
MGRCFGGRRPVGKPRGRWEDTVTRVTVDLLQIRNWKATARKRKGWRKEIEEAMNQKRAGVPYKKKQLVEVFALLSMKQ